MDMSSAQPTAISLSEELINGLHLVTLIDKTTEVLRSKFHQYFPIDQTDLYKEISKHKQKLRKLLGQGILYQTQYHILLPSSRKTNSLKFDISLLTIALRVLCPFQAPITGWKSLPLPSDQSEGACLVRIRIDRNNLLHNDFKYQNKEYGNIWNRMTSALEGLGCDKQELLDLKSASLHPALQIDHQKKLQDLKHALQCVADLEDSLEGVTYNLFSSLPSFVGRDQELLEIHQKLAEREESQLAMVIHGLGGVGKSELIRQYCKRHAATDYKQNVIWINAEDINSMTEDFFNVAERIKLKTTDENDKQLSIKTVANKVYRFFADRPVLFVFDNAIHKSEIMEFMEINTSTNVSIIITSQFAEWSERFIQMRIDVLSTEAASQLISQSLDKKHISTKENTYILCEKMRYFPLALQQAIAYIKRWSITITEYLEQFETHFDSVLTDHHGDEKYDKTIMTTWDMALQKLKEEKNSSLAITFICMMSYLDGKNIKKELFYEYHHKHSVKESLELLQKYSLITITTVDDDLQQTILMHSLLQYVIRKKTGHDYLHELLDMIFIESNTIELENASYGKYWYYHLIYMFSKREWHNILVPKASKYINQLISTFNSKGKSSMLLQILIVIEKFQIDTIGYQNEQILTTQHNIANCLLQMGKYDEALIKFMDVEKLQMDSIGCKHPDTLTTQNNIANCLRRMGKYDEALIKFMEVDKLQMDSIGCKHPNTLTTQHNIANCLLQMGKYDESLNKFMKVEKLRIDSIGCKHPDTLTTQNNFAACLQQMGKYDEALMKSMEVEKLRIDIIGCNHPDTLITQHNIAVCLQRMGKYDRALIKFMEVEKLQIDLIGCKHPSALNTQYNVANCLLRMHKYNEALIKFVEVEKLTIESIGCEHPFTLKTQNNIANCLQNMGNYDEALVKSMEIEKLQICIIGCKHPDTIATQHDIANCLLKMGKYDEALIKFTEVEKLRIDIIGCKHPETLATQSNIAFCLLKMGEYDETLIKFSEIEQLEIEVVGRKHPSTLRTQRNIAQCLQKMNNFKKALVKYSQVEKLQIDTFGPKNIETIYTQQCIASCVKEQALYSEYVIINQ